MKLAQHTLPQPWIHRHEGKPWSQGNRVSQAFRGMAFSTTFHRWSSINFLGGMQLFWRTCKSILQSHRGGFWTPL